MIFFALCCGSIEKPYRTTAMSNALTPATLDLPLIFWHIRAARDDSTRRSWQRRARLALASREDLTPAERIEIAAVWSRPDCDRYDSPALRKITGQKAALPEYQRIPARQAIRAGLAQRGSRTAQMFKFCRVVGVDAGMTASNETLFSPVAQASSGIGPALAFSP